MMNESSGIVIFCTLVATIVILNVGAPSVRGAISAVSSAGCTGLEHCGDDCSAPTGGERPCGEECLCYLCHSSGAGTWMLSSIDGLPVPVPSTTVAATDEILDWGNVSLRIYHPPKL
jgi:hypothetical protein